MNLIFLGLLLLIPAIIAAAVFTESEFLQAAAVFFTGGMLLYSTVIAPTQKIELDFHAEFSPDVIMKTNGITTVTYCKNTKFFNSTDTQYYFATNIVVHKDIYKNAYGVKLKPIYSVKVKGESNEEKK